MENITWEYCQNNSDLILACGIDILLKSNEITELNQLYNNPGNYLISHNKKYYYIGEAKELRKRIKQQFTNKTSTFYKNYLKSLKYFELDKIPILEFNLNVISTQIGRKEIEEFAIVNLGTKLNKFQRGKRELVKVEIKQNIWHKIQENAENLLEQGENILFNQPFLSWFDSKPTREPGIYIVKDNKESLIYIGESSNVFDRYTTHCGTTYFSALRRHIGTEILDFNFIDSKKRKFKASDDNKINEYLRVCKYSSMPIHFGRFELESFLIKKHQPLLNRKDNK